MLGVHTAVYASLYAPRWVYPSLYAPRWVYPSLYALPGTHLGREPSLYPGVYQVCTMVYTAVNGVYFSQC